MPHRFWKLQGAGNDFVVLDATAQSLPPLEACPPNFQETLTMFRDRRAGRHAMRMWADYRFAEGQPSNK